CPSVTCILTTASARQTRPSHRIPSSFLYFFFSRSRPHRDLPSFPTRRSSDLKRFLRGDAAYAVVVTRAPARRRGPRTDERARARSEEHTSELQSRENLVCRLLLEKKKQECRNTRSQSSRTFVP